MITNFNRPETFAFRFRFFFNTRKQGARDRLFGAEGCREYLNLHVKCNVNNEGKIFRIEPDSNLPSKAKLLNGTHTKNVR